MRKSFGKMSGWEKEWEQIAEKFFLGEKYDFLGDLAVMVEKPSGGHPCLLWSAFGR